MDKLLRWDVYEITSTSTKLHGVRCRGRIRKYCIEEDITVLVENASDVENAVRFAVLENSSIAKISALILKLFPNTHVKKVMENVPNPVLSKLLINKVERYTL